MERPYSEGRVRLDTFSGTYGGIEVSALAFKEGWIVTNTTPFLNIPNYPEMEKVQKELDSVGRVISLDCDSIAKDVGSPKSANMVLLGASASVMKIIDEDKLREGITEVFKRKGDKIVEMNIAAFNAGLEVSKKFI